MKNNEKTLLMYLKCMSVVNVRKKRLTSLPPAWSCADPPFAHKTGTFMAFPESAIDRAACPSPTTITPLMGIPSICSHNAVSTLAENLIEDRKYDVSKKKFGAEAVKKSTAIFSCDTISCIVEI